MHVFFLLSFANTVLYISERSSYLVDVCYHCGVCALVQLFTRKTEMNFREQTVPKR